MPPPHRFHALLLLACASFASTACGTVADIANVPEDADAPDSPPSGPEGGPDSSPSPSMHTDAGTCAPPTPGAWGIALNGLSTACTTSSDCQAVQIGEDVCQSSAGCCANAAISVSSYNSTYEPEYEAINSACSPFCDPNGGGCECAGQAVFCDHGTCELGSPDASVPDAASSPDANGECCEDGLTWTGCCSTPANSLAHECGSPGGCNLVCEAQHACGK
jgi:hypothetical protein